MTLRDWIQLLTIPVVLAIDRYVFTLAIRRNEQKSVKQHDQSERESASDTQREATLSLERRNNNTRLPQTSLFQARMSTILSVTSCSAAIRYVTLFYWRCDSYAPARSACDTRCVPAPRGRLGFLSR